MAANTGKQDGIRSAEVTNRHFDPVECALRRAITRDAGLCVAAKSEADEYLDVGEYGLATLSILAGSDQLSAGEWQAIRSDLASAIELMSNDQELADKFLQEDQRMRRTTPPRLSE